MDNSIERILIFPTNGKSFTEQLTNCLDQIHEHCETNNTRILQQSFFICPQHNEAYQIQRQEILTALKLNPGATPSTSVIAQPPAYGHLVTVELILVIDGTGREVIYREYENIPYTLVESVYSREIYAAGISSYDTTGDFVNQAEDAFRLLKGILRSEGLTMADIVRQWNYVENILSVQDEEGHINQHYQILNDVRSRYYAEASFNKGFPAATGIGMNTGGIILEIYAVLPRKHVEIHPLKNPLQVDAYNYSDRVLVGDATAGQQIKTTPKFERAKYIGINSEANVYISGTAAIHNELTIGVDDPIKQTETTIENIASLISVENLQMAGIEWEGREPIYQFIRVYIKNQDYLESVRKICSKRFPGIPVHYLIADVCRDNLLVEIEGVASLG
jgi:enamine deaminase RidA (YjgF/YER057c/UK114 family)